MSVPMGYLDFAPEPAAPTATPVTEHVDLSCNPTDTRDISSEWSIDNNPVKYLTNAVPTLDYAQHAEDLPHHSEIRIKFETLRSLEAQEAMALESQGGSPSHNSNGGNAAPTNGTVTVSSAGETHVVQNSITTSSSSTNGHQHHHHSPESLPECGSPEMQQSVVNQMPLTPITPNSELDLSRVKQEPEPMNVIVKQEVISAGGNY